ncbi:MAG: thioredoxin family protein [Candidatus Cloacimonas sp.]|nr:thioredoxin family protein [Candidatus Cloacimonadota bacterium]
MKKIMSMRWAIALLIIATLSLVSCDRFDHKFEPPVIDNSFELHLKEYIKVLQEALQSLDATLIDRFFSDSYLNNGLSKSEQIEFIFSLAEDKEVVETELMAFNIDKRSFTYSLFNGEDEHIFDEYADTKDSGFLFIGDGEDADEPDDPDEPENAKILVELFTGTWCPNCPYVESALDRLKDELGNSFYYLEYHIMDQFNTNHTDLLGYYNLPSSLPVSMIQGELSIPTGSADGSYPQYKYAIEQRLNTEAKVLFSEFDYSTNDEELSFAVKLKKTGELGSKLELRYALIDKETSVKNSAGDFCANVVIKKGSVTIDEDAFEGDTVLITTDFIKPSYNFTSPSLTIWVQNIEDNYDSSTCVVYNVDEYPVLLVD